MDLGYYVLYLHHGFGNKRSTGKKMHILGEVNSDMYYSPCLVAEDLEGNFIPVGTDESNAVNWNEIDETEWLNELKMRDNS